MIYHESLVYNILYYSTECMLPWLYKPTLYEPRQVINCYTYKPLCYKPPQNLYEPV